MRVFLDTNVVIDFCAQREDFFHQAALIFQLGKQGRIELAASATTFINSFYILKKSYSHGELYSKLHGIAELCTISTVDETVIQQAFGNEYKDFEDAVQYFSAKSVKADVVITRNKSDFTMAKENELKTPEEFLDYFYESGN